MLKSIFILFMLAIIAGTQNAHADEASVRVWAGNCQVCHGPDGASIGAIPSLNTLSPQEIMDIVAAYRADKKPATVMGVIAKGYTPEQIRAVAAVLGKQP